MSLTVPLAVRLVTARQDRHVTRDLRDLTLRSVVPGGFASLSMSLDRPLHIQPDDIDYYAAAYVYGPDGGVVWEGRLEDPGRGVSGDGLVWEIAAVGPSAHAEDLMAPLILVDQSVNRWQRTPSSLAALETNSESVLTEQAPGWRLRFPRGTVVNTGIHGGIQYRAIRDADQLLARISYAYQMGVTDSNLRARWKAVRGQTELITDIAWTTTPGSASHVVVTNWGLVRNLMVLDLERNTSALTVADDETWALFTGLTVVAVRYNADGSYKTTGYTDTVLASEVVADLLGRMLPRYDGANAAIASTSYPIQSLAEPDGIRPRQMLDQMMQLEPAFYWAAWESGPGSRVPVTKVSDTYSRTVSNGWGTADTGQAWNTSGGAAADYSVTGTKGRHSVASVNVARHTYVDDTVRDWDVTGSITIPVLASGNDIRAGLMLRFVNPSTFYYAEVQVNVGGGVDLQLWAVGGTGIITTITTGITHAAPTTYKIRAQISGSVFRAKVWTTGTEPVPWTAAVVDSSLSTPGGVGCRTNLPTGNTNTLPVLIDFDDVVAVEPATSRHRFEWATWPTQVRYEADIVDGFDSPGSAEGLYDRVRVRYRTVSDETRTVVRTQIVRELADAGLPREAFLDIGSDRTQTDAEQAGDSFLAEHKTPPNAGRLTIARPIVDLIGGGMVQPYEIRPGNLIRVRGVLPSVDSLNATDRDGVTVFRIVGVTFQTSSASAELELDSYPLTVARALADLKRGRQ